jgi:hypothetical protein
MATASNTFAGQQIKLEQGDTLKLELSQPDPGELTRVQREGSVVATKFLGGHPGPVPADGTRAVDREMV